MWKCVGVQCASKRIIAMYLTRFNSTTRNISLWRDQRRSDRDANQRSVRGVLAVHRSRCYQLFDTRDFTRLLLYTHVQRRTSWVAGSARGFLAAGSRYRGHYKIGGAYTRERKVSRTRAATLFARGSVIDGYSRIRECTVNNLYQPKQTDPRARAHPPNSLGEGRANLRIGSDTWCKSRANSGNRDTCRVPGGRLQIFLVYLYDSRKKENWKNVRDSGSLRHTSSGYASFVEIVLAWFQCTINLINRLGTVSTEIVSSSHVQIRILLLIRTRRMTKYMYQESLSPSFFSSRTQLVWCYHHQP